MMGGACGSRSWSAPACDSRFCGCPQLPIGRLANCPFRVPNIDGQAACHLNITAICIQNNNRLSLALQHSTAALELEPRNARALYVW